MINKCDWTLGENKPNQTQSQLAPRPQAVSQSGFREFHRRFQAKNEGYLTNF